MISQGPWHETVHSELRDHLRPQALFAVVFLLYAAGAAFAWMLRPAPVPRDDNSPSTSEDAWSEA